MARPVSSLFSLDNKRTQHTKGDGVILGDYHPDYDFGKPSILFFERQLLTTRLLDKENIQKF